MYGFCFAMVTLLLVTVNILFVSALSEYKYAQEREILKQEEQDFSDNHEVLNEDEIVVDNYMEYLKWLEFDETRDNFPPARPIQDVMTQIKRSEVYRVLKQFPKGGNMHLHMNQILSKQKMLDMIFDSPLYEHLSVMTEGKNQWKLKFYNNPPEGWVKVKSDPILYSKKSLLQHLTLINELDEEAIANPTDSEKRWVLMNPCFSRAGSGLVKFANYTRMHLRAIFESALEENVQYLEARSSGQGVYVLDDSTESKQRVIDTEDGDVWASVLREELENFKKAHPEFIGYREIRYQRRSETELNVKKEVERALRVRQKYPDIVGGFDLVSEEDQGHSLLFYLDDFAELNDKDRHIPYFFHTAETSWPNDLMTSLDKDDPVSTLDNVYEAIILGAKRVGHGIGFIKHPYLMQVLKEKKIAIETNPVSNMLLSYVTDQRQHPAVTYIRYGIPVVMGSDDPGSLGYNEFTIDWYVAFMGWGLNLKDLKRLALNSLNYSTLGVDAKLAAVQKWTNSWNIFIGKMKEEACNNEQQNPSIDVEVFRIYPADGSISKSTKVRIFGRHFESAICKDVVCKFGESESKGRLIYMSMITCDAVPVILGQSMTVPFSISLNSGLDFHETNLTFSFVH